MRLKCIHGYFIIEDFSVGQISDFMSRFGLEIVQVGKHYTFSQIAEAPTYTISGGEILDTPAIATFEGEPWEVFEANEVVYNFSTGLVVPISTITQITTVTQVGNRFASPGLILPGSYNMDRQQIRDYTAWYSRDTLRFLYSEVGYV